MKKATKGKSKTTTKRALGNTNPEQAKAVGWIVDKGDPGAWETVSKAHHDGIGMMKSTKRMQVDGGYLYCVTTEGKLGYAESVTFVPTDNLESVKAMLRQAGREVTMAQANETRREMMLLGYRSYRSMQMITPPEEGTPARVAFDEGVALAKSDADTATPAVTTP